MLRILVVDDSKEDLLLAERILWQCKLLNPIILFHSAEKFIRHVEVVQQAGATPEPALILLDVVMSPTSGQDVLRYLQSSPYGKHSVVVMVSGLTDIKAMHEGYQLGAKTFLLKPISPMDVVELVNSLSPSIVVEQSKAGYTLHWNQGSGTDTDLIAKSSRMAAFSA